MTPPNAAVAATAIYYGVKALDLALMLFVGTLEAKAELEKRRGILFRLSEEKRDPTDAEWQDLYTTIGSLRNKLHS